MISHCFCGSGIWPLLAGWFYLGGSFEVAVKNSGALQGLTGISGAGRGHSHLSAGWTAAGGATSKMRPSRGHRQEASAPDHVERPKRPLEHPHNMAAALPPKQRSQNRKQRKFLGRGHANLLCIVSVLVDVLLYT